MATAASITAASIKMKKALERFRESGVSRERIIYYLKSMKSDQDMKQHSSI